MVAAFGDLQVGVVARGQLDALRRYQVDQRVVVLAWRYHFVHGIDYLLVLLRASDRQHAGVHVTDAAFLDTHAAGDDDLAVFLDRFADHFQRLGLGAVDEAAGVDHHYVGILVGGHDFITFHTQLGQNALGIYQGFWATQADEPYLGGGGSGGHD
ncbi:hypothetical protein D3C78_1170760 [compost metagenome]